MLSSAETEGPPREDPCGVEAWGTPPLSAVPSGKLRSCAFPIGRKVKASLSRSQNCQKMENKNSIVQVRKTKNEAEKNVFSFRGTEVASFLSFEIRSCRHRRPAVPLRSGQTYFPGAACVLGPHRI